MKLSFPAILLISLIGISKGQQTGPSPIAVDNTAPADAPAEVVSDKAPDGDAGRECAADDCGASAADEDADTATEAEPTEASEVTEEEDVEIDNTDPADDPTDEAPDVNDCAGDDCGASAADADADAATEAEPTEASKVAEEEDANCPSRPHVIRCAAKYLDTNHNGMLERSELESVMETVPWLLRGLLNMIGSVDTIMKKCDADGDGAITIDVDMEATKETCLATCFKRYAFKKLFFPECTE